MVDTIVTLAASLTPWDPIWLILWATHRILGSFYKAECVTISGFETTGMDILTITMVKHDIHIKDGWRLQNGYNFGKVPWGGVILNPKNYIAGFGTFKHGFLSMKFPENGGGRPFGTFMKLIRFGAVTRPLYEYHVW